ncbi:MAG TPA: uroporphyrinogen-III synthase [Ktedonobacteraceae bacterium]|nr:uroporphyrinogen-III synthase [Ktedonobacteraceae bacterium]
MQGKRIVITRALHQAEELATLLTQRGAEVLLYPCIAIEPPRDTTLLDRVLRDLAEGAFDWLVVTSANAVMILSQRCKILGLAPASSVALACVGPATAEAARRLLSMRSQALPEEYIAEALLEVLRPALPARVLILQAEKARPALSEELVAAGATITRVTTYRTMPGEGGIHLGMLLKQRQVDAITFTSASTVQNCAQRLCSEGADISLLMDMCLACIGPLTAQAVRQLGCIVSVMPTRHTIEGLVEGLEAYFAGS